MNDLKLGIKDTPKKWYEWILYPIQMLLAVFVATVLIANICGTPISTALIGAAIGTILYEIITGFKSPMFVSSCGATVSGVMGALLLGVSSEYTTPQEAIGAGVAVNYVAVAIGGVVILLVYLLLGLLIKFGGKKYFDKVFPPVIVGAVTIVIGLNLASFIPGYVHMDNAGNIHWVEVVVAIFTMLITAITTHYGKGFLKTIGFLVGLLSGYVLALIIELCGGYEFNIVKTITDIKWITANDFVVTQWKNSPFEWSQLPSIIGLFLPVSICAALEHYSDHKVLSNIIGTDLTQNPGLDKTLLANGISSAVGAVIGGQPVTSYGEGIATIGFSKVASVWMTLIAAIILGIMGFIAPVTSFIESIPSAVFGGCSMILYGYIAASGLKTMFNNKVDLEDNKNLIIVSVILTVGVSGIYLFDKSFKGVSLAMVLGVILNLLFSIHKKPNHKKLISLRSKSGIYEDSAEIDYEEFMKKTKENEE